MTLEELDVQKELDYYGDVEFRKFLKISRLVRETVTITEKIDGTNGQICVWRDKRGCLHIRAGGRNRWLTEKDHNFHFYDFVMANAVELIEGLGEGRHYGEWYGQGINRNYGLKEKRFALFNTQKWAGSHLPECCGIVPVLGTYSLDFVNAVIDNCRNRLIEYGSHLVEGFMEPEGLMLYLHDLGRYYKVLFENNEGHKGKRHE